MKTFRISLVLILIATGCTTLDNEKILSFPADKWTLTFTNDSAQFHEKPTTGTVVSYRELVTEEKSQIISTSPLTKEIGELNAESSRILKAISSNEAQRAMAYNRCKRKADDNVRVVLIKDSNGRLRSIPTSTPLYSNHPCGSGEFDSRYSTLITNNLITANHLFAALMSGNLLAMEHALMALSSVKTSCEKLQTTQKSASDYIPGCPFSNTQLRVTAQLLERFLRVSAPSGKSEEDLSKLYSERKKGNGLRLGMNQEDLLKHAIWGKPEHGINTVTQSGKTQEQWIYKVGEESLNYAFVYVENGKLVLHVNPNPTPFDPRL